MAISWASPGFSGTGVALVDRWLSVERDRLEDELVGRVNVSAGVANDAGVAILVVPLPLKCINHQNAKLINAVHAKRSVGFTIASSLVPIPGQ